MRLQSRDTTVFVKYFLKTNSQLNLHTNERPFWSIKIVILVHCTYTIHEKLYPYPTLVILPCTALDNLYTILYMFIVTCKHWTIFSLQRWAVTFHFYLSISKKSGTTFPNVMQVSIKPAQFLGKLPNWWSSLCESKWKWISRETWISRGYDETERSHWLSFLIKYGWKCVDRGSNSH